MDKKSKYGYKSQSPYRDSPYLDINTPQGVITMEDVPHDILGITPEGEIQHMKAGNKNPYVFNSDVVREIPIRQKGGRAQALYKYLFDDDEEVEKISQPKPTLEAPTQDELPPADVHELGDPDTELAMQILMQDQEEYFLTDQYRDIANSSEGMPGFRSFGSYAEGKAALHNQLELYKTGRTKNPVNPNSTLLEAMSVYAPAADNNNPTHYAGFIAKNLGISVNTPIKNIDTKKWADAIEKMEGNKKGNNPGNLRR